MLWACILAFANDGRSSPARMAIMAMTTSNSIKVKPNRFGSMPVNFQGPLLAPILASLDDLRQQPSQQFCRQHRRIDPRLQPVDGLFLLTRRLAAGKAGSNWPARCSCADWPH